MSSPRAATAMAFVVLFTGFALWAYFTELDYGVHAEGKVESLNPNVAIQHNTVARVAGVHVTEGDLVRAGTPLITLDDSETLAESLRSETQRLVLGLQIAALIAEQKENSNLAAPPDLVGNLPNEVVRKAHSDAQEALRQRLLAHKSKLAQFEEEIGVTRKQMEQRRQELAIVSGQADIVSKQLTGMESMLTDGLISRNQVDEQRFRLEELKRSKVRLGAELESMAGQITQSEAARRVYLADRAKEIDGKLAETRPQVKAVEQQAEASAVKLRSKVIVAPVDGQAVNVKVKAEGEVINPGMILMELVPAQRRYFVSAKVNPSEVETVHAGQSAEIKFTTLPSKSTPYVAGRLMSISSDSVKDEKTGMAYYIAQVEFVDDVTQKIGMEPVLGMQVSVLLKGGKRSVISYIVDPFSALFMRAMREH